MAGLAYKWKLDDCKYGYLTDEKGGEPFITAAVVDEGPISNVVKNFTEEEYKTHYEALCVLIKNESGTQNMVMLDYKYYYNIDDTNCGLLQYGGTAYVGAQGITGTGIRSIETIYNTANTIIRFHLTDGTYYDAVIRNGIDGVNGINGIDGIDGEHRNVVLEIENQKQDLDNLREEILSTVTEEMNTRLKSSQEALDAFGMELSGITHSIASAITTVDQVRGIEDKINFYINASALTKTEFNNIINPYSGFMETIGQRIDAVDSSVAYYQDRVDLAENYYKKAISYYDAIAGNLNEYWTKYDAVNNRLENVVAELTGNSSMTLSEIYQTSREVGLVVTNNEATDINGDPITAAIVAKINDTGSTITIDASKIYMLGETVASALTTLDLDINGGYSHFNSDGSGWIANKGIYWDKSGNMTITGQLSVGDVIDDLGNSDVTFGKQTDARTIFSKDGSGSLAGGNIYWDKYGNMTITGQLTISDVIEDLEDSDITLSKHTAARTIFSKDGSGSLAGGNIYWDNLGTLTIKKDVKIEGMLSVDEIVDSLGNKIISFGNSSTKAITYFYPDGSGSLAGGNIYWDKSGNMTITGQLSVGDVIENLGDSDITLGKHTDARTIFSKDGSGSLAGGNIYWDKYGALTIKKDVKIEGTLSVDEIADSLGNRIISFGNSNTDAMTYFYPDGSGSLAGGAISWDTDGSIKIAGNLSVAGSITQEVLNGLNTDDVNLGGSTTYFGPNGDGYIANKLISWDTKGNMNISGNVVIGENASAITDSTIAALNVRDISIGKGSTYFGKDGSGKLANGSITWTSEGTLSIDAALIQSTGYSLDDIQDKNYIYLPEITIDTVYYLGTKSTDRGKTITVFNSSPYSGGTYILYCKDFEVTDFGGLNITSESDNYKNYIKPQECAIFTCFEHAKNKYSWELVNRFSQDEFRPDLKNIRGRYPRLIVSGKYIDGDNYPMAYIWDRVTKVALDNININAKGIYEVRWSKYPNEITEDGNTDFTPVVQVYDSEGTANACVTNIYDNGFDVAISDGGKIKKGSFYFMIFAKDHTWTYDLLYGTKR